LGSCDRPAPSDPHPAERGPGGVGPLLCHLPRLLRRGRHLAFARNDPAGLGGTVPAHQPGRCHHYRHRRCPPCRSAPALVATLATADTAHPVLVFGALGWTGLTRGPARRWWIASAVTAIGALTLIGLLSATGVIGRTIVG